MGPVGQRQPRQGIPTPRDHGLLQQRDLPRIGALSLHVNTRLTGAFTVSEQDHAQHQRQHGE
jgi:hypothetical protein